MDTISYYYFPQGRRMKEIYYCQSTFRVIVICVLGLFLIYNEDTATHISRSYVHFNVNVFH